MSINKKDMAKSDAVVDSCRTTMLSFIGVLFLLFYVTSNAAAVCPSNVKHLESGTTYLSLQAAYNDVASQGFATLLLVSDSDLSENVVFNQELEVRLEGGYDCDFNLIVGQTELIGNMLISGGSATMDRITLASAPPRFTDNGNGTVTDNNTGLIWLKNADCFGFNLFSQAVSAVAALADGACGLTDGSQPGDWRLPEENNADLSEWRDLIDLTYTKPTLSNTAGTAQWSEGDAFNSVVNTFYWSGTDAPDSAYAYAVNLINGSLSERSKTSYSKVWPVKNP